MKTQRDPDMGKKKAKVKAPPYVMVTWAMLNSAAYKALPSSAAKALPYFLGKVKDKDHWHPEDPARCKIEFLFSYGEARRLGFGRSTFFKMLRDLVRFGFIDLMRKGYKSKDGSKMTSAFALSTRWQNFGLPSFTDGDWKKHFPETEGVLKVNSISPKNELF